MYFLRIWFNSLEFAYTIALTPRQYRSHMLLNRGCPPMSQIYTDTTQQHQGYWVSSLEILYILALLHYSKA